MFSESHIFRGCNLISLACVYTIIETMESVSPKHLLVFLLPFPTIGRFVVFAFSYKLKNALVMLVFILCVWRWGTHGMTHVWGPEADSKDLVLFSLYVGSGI